MTPRLEHSRLSSRKAAIHPATGQLLLQQHLLRGSQQLVAQACTVDIAHTAHRLLLLLPPLLLLLLSSDGLPASPSVSFSHHNLHTLIYFCAVWR